MFRRPGDTALVLFVPEAEPVVGSWRQKYDPSAAEGMPAHITILFPFVGAGALNDQILDEIARICADVPSMEFTFSEFGWFPGVLWLRPGTTLCSQLVTRIRTRWPELLPYGQSNLEVIPHLTITDGASEAVAGQAQADVARHLPLEAAITAATLVAFDGRAWVRQSEFALGSGLATTAEPTSHET